MNEKDKEMLAAFAEVAREKWPGIPDKEIEQVYEESFGNCGNEDIKIVEVYKAVFPGGYIPFTSMYAEDLYECIVNREPMPEPDFPEGAVI